MSVDELSIGLLGCGAIAQFAHLPALERARRVRLTALCDSSAELLEQAGRRAGVSALFTDAETFFRKAEMQAVLIAVPDALHAPLAQAAMRAGKHVLVEKPLGVTVQECEALAQTALETDRKLQVGCMKRHDPGMAFARRFIQEQLGELLSLRGWYLDSLFRPAMQEALLPPLLGSNRSSAKSQPGFDRERYDLYTHGAHLFDTLGALGGRITAVTAQRAKKYGQHSWHGLLEFQHGGLGQFELTVKVQADWSEGYVVQGQHGSVEIHTRMPFYQRPSEVRAFDARTQQWRTPLGAESNPYKNQLEAFANCILDDLPAYPGVEEGLAAVELLQAVEQSVKSERRVELTQEALVR